MASISTALERVYRHPSLGTDGGLATYLGADFGPVG
jgi:hypothetical protein